MTFNRDIKGFFVPGNYCVGSLDRCLKRRHGEAPDLQMAIIARLRP